MQRVFVKVTKLWLILQAIPFITAFAYPTCETPFPMSIPNLECGFAFSVSALALQPLGSPLDYAILTNPLPVPTPNWSMQSIKAKNYKMGFDLGIGYVIPNSGNDMQLNWIHWDHTYSNSVSADNTQFVGPLFEIGPAAATIRQARGKAKFNYDIVNLDVGQFVNFGTCTQMRFFAGLSGAQLKQELISTFQDNAPTFSMIVNNRSKFNGLGPRFGVNANFEMCKGFGLVGQMAGFALIGSVQPNTHFTSTSPTLALLGISVNEQAINSRSTTQVVPGLDAKLGINYSFQFACATLFTVEAGYLVATYINAVTSYNPSSLVTPLQTGTIPVATMGKNQSNFSLGGLYLNFKLKI